LLAIPHSMKINFIQFLRIWKSILKEVWVKDAIIFQTRLKKICVFLNVYK
jgi:hypothetical protein